MPFVEPNTSQFFTPRAATQEEVVLPPTIGETISSAFRLENDVVAMFDYHKPFYPDRNFDIQKTLKDNGIENEWEHYFDVESEEEFLWRKGRIESERKARQTLAAAGWGGTIAMMGAGLLSPTSLLPAVGAGARGWQAVRTGAALVGGSAALQEIPLFETQFERTWEEGAFSIGASTFLGALLGPLIGRVHQKHIDRMSAAIENPSDQIIFRQFTAPIGSSAGAKEALVDAGKLAPGWGNRLSAMFPNLRMIQSDDPVARHIGASYGTGGLALEGNRIGIAGASGGDIETLAKLTHARILPVVDLLDEQFANYRMIAPGRLRNLRADAASLFNRGEKLSKSEFREEIGKYAHLEKEHEIPEIARVVKEVKKLYDEVWEEAVRVGLFKDGQVDLKGAQRYANILYRNEIIGRKRNQFIDLLAANTAQRLQKEFAERAMKLNERAARRTTEIEDLQRPAEEARALREKFQEELAAREKEFQTQSPHLQDIADDLDLLRAQLRAIDPKATGAPEIRKSLREEIAKLEEQGGEGLKQYRTSRRDLRKRMTSLSRARAIVEEKQAKKLAKIERSEELQMSSLRRAVYSLRRLATMLDKTDEKSIAKEVSKVKNDFARAAETYDRTQEQLVKMIEAEPDDLAILTKDELQQNQALKMNDLAARLDDLESFDREAFKASIDEMMDFTLLKVQNLNARRAVRQQRLIAQAENLDPKLVDARIADLLAKNKADRMNYTDQLRALGVEDGMENLNAKSFDTYARNLAEDVTTRILGIDSRLPYSELLQSDTKRGPELARTLEIDPEFTHNGVSIAEFRENDIERMLEVYMRTMGADMAITERLGDPLMLEWMQKLIDNETAKVRALETAVDKNGNPLSKEAIEAQSEKIKKEYAELRKDALTLMARVKGIRGVPTEPDSWAARAARMVMQLNALRLMGGVVIASVSDPANIWMKHGLTRTFRDGFLPFINGVKDVPLTKKQARQMLVAVETSLHSRYHALSDVFDTYRRGSKFEKGLEYASTKLGAVALFDQWTNAFKQINAGASVMRVVDEIEMVMTGKGSKKEIDDAINHLAALNIDRPYIEAIWDQLTARGAGRRVEGRLLPNTDDWDMTAPGARESLRAFRAAVLRETDDVIVTPGVERPRWMDANVPARLLSQFRSFGMSSTTKITMASLQQRDGAVVQALVVRLALGALSYYLYAKAVGGDTETEMLNAPLSKWADEAIARSGTIGVFDELQRILQRIPATAPYASFSGRRSSRREGGNLLEALAGPSLDLLFEKGAGVLMGLDSPTKQTAHLFRQMLPFQNLFYLRRVFDLIEAAAARNLPERR